MSQVVYGGEPKVTLLSVGHKTIIAEDSEHCGEMRHMSLPIGTVYQNIIKKYQDKLAQKWTKHMVD